MSRNRAASSGAFAASRSRMAAAPSGAMTEKIACSWMRRRSAYASASRAAAAALPDADRHARRRQPVHGREGQGDLAGDAVGLRVGPGIGARDVDEREQRQPEATGERDGAAGQAVARGPVPAVRPLCPRPRRSAAITTTRRPAMAARPARNVGSVPRRSTHGAHSRSAHCLPVKRCRARARCTSPHARRRRAPTSATTAADGRGDGALDAQHDVDPGRLLVLAHERVDQAVARTRTRRCASLRAVARPSVSSTTRGPVKPMTAPGRAAETSTSDAYDASTPPVVGPRWTASDRSPAAECSRAAPRGARHLDERHHALPACALRPTRSARPSADVPRSRAGTPARPSRRAPRPSSRRAPRSGPR